MGGKNSTCMVEVIIYDPFKVYTMYHFGYLATYNVLFGSEWKQWQTATLNPAVSSYSGDSAPLKMPKSKIYDLLSFVSFTIFNKTVFDRNKERPFVSFGAP